MSNKNLNSAKKAKNNEFYTRYEDIEKELRHYDLKGKSIYCNTDDYRKSNFVKYFVDNFNTLGIDKITATCFDNGDGAYMYQYNGINAIQRKLDGDGDFRSEECVELLKESDIVITNPPFSLFREFVSQMMEYDKKFLIIGNVNAISYKEIFPLIKDNKLWAGVSTFNNGMYFGVPNDYKYKDTYKFKREIDGKKVMRVSSICWFTNIEHKKRNYPLDLYKKYDAEKYPKYDNYDAIHCERVEDIPCDYYGIIGVPLTFVGKYCPTQFEIVKFRKGDDNKDLCIKGKKNIYFRILIRSVH